VIEETTLYRSRQQARAVRLACLVGGPVLLTGYAVAPIGSAAPRIAALVVAAGLPVLYLMRLRWAGVSIAGGTVHIVNVTRSVDVSLSNVDRFTVGPGRFFPRIGKLVLRDGSAIHIWAIQSTLNQHVRASDRGAHDVVDELNAALRLDQREVA